MSETLFYLTVPDLCPYLPDREEQKLLAHLEPPNAGEIYSKLAQNGFRRSRDWAYRPRCPACTACTPVRIPVADFRSRRAWRRVLNRNRDLQEQRRPATFSEPHWRLFHRYLDARHTDSEMASMGREDYREMVEGSPLDSFLLEWRDSKDRVAAVLIVDPLGDGFSAVYSFFDPDRSSSSPGSFMVLRLVELARREGREFVYLGYWIPEGRKMDYKARFRPLEALGHGGWQRLATPRVE